MKWWLLVFFFGGAVAWSAPLPDLGEPSRQDLSVADEAHLGASIMRNLRRDPDFIEDNEIIFYLNRLGERLSAVAPPGPFSLKFFLINDLTFNAFALPGGYIGVHSGTIITTQTEDELAAVLAHETGHVRRQHMARMVADQRGSQAISLLGLVAGVLAGVSGNSQGLLAGIYSSQALASENALIYSRDFEREADNTGLQILSSAGYDAKSMEDIFARMMQKEAPNDSGFIPAYFRSHPLTTERIANIENRLGSLPKHSLAPAEPEFQFVKAKLIARQGNKVVNYFRDQLKQPTELTPAAAHYGLVLVMLQNGNLSVAEEEMQALQGLKVESPMVDDLAARLVGVRGNVELQIAELQKNHQRYPDYRPTTYELLDVLLQTGANAEIVQLGDDELRLRGADAKIYEYQSQAWAGMKKELQEHRTLAEAMILRQEYPEALAQLTMASQAGDGTAYEKAAVTARIKELQSLQPNKKKSTSEKDEKQ